MLCSFIPKRIWFPDPLKFKEKWEAASESSQNKGWVIYWLSNTSHVCLPSFTDTPRAPPCTRSSAYRFCHSFSSFRLIQSCGGPSSSSSSSSSSPPPSDPNKAQNKKDSQANHDTEIKGKTTRLELPGPQRQTVTYVFVYKVWAKFANDRFNLVLWKMRGS